MIRRFCAVLLGGLLTGACAVGAPPGFSSGDAWSVPMAAPLEAGQVLVPVKINGGGPYLFMLDPDSPISAVDAAIVSEHDLYTKVAEEVITEGDTKVPIALAEAKTIAVGDLTVDNRLVRVIPGGSITVSGRTVRGLLGRDVLADSLVLGIDRDRGMVYLSTQGHLEVPPDAAAIGFRDETGEMHFRSRHYTHSNLVPGRMIAKARINGESVDVHLDLGAEHSALWTKQFDKLGLPKVAVAAVLFDEVGYRYQVQGGAMIADLALGDVERKAVMAIPYQDKRWDDTEFDGLIGQNVFHHYKVFVNFHQNRFHLAPRAADELALVDERLRRWGSAFEACQNPACVDVALEGGVNPAAGPAPAAGESAATASDAAATEPGDDGATTDATGDDAATDATGDDATAADATGDDATATDAVEPAAGADAPAPVAPVAPVAPPSQPLQLTVTRESGAPGIAYEIVLAAIDAEGNLLDVPNLSVTLPENLPMLTERRLGEEYRAAAGFRVVDVSPFPRACKNAPGGAMCVARIVLPR